MGTLVAAAAREAIFAALLRMQLLPSPGQLARFPMALDSFQPEWLLLALANFRAQSAYRCECCG